MRVAWAPLLLGLGCVAAGLLLLQRGWQDAMAGFAPSTAAALGAGALLLVLGALMVAVPLLVPVLYKLYGPEAFTSRGTACPVVSKCARCGEFNFRGRADCKGCGVALAQA